MDENHGAAPLPATLKRINMRRFLDELRRSGPSTRADLARATGVSSPTASRVVSDLLETGLVEEIELSFKQRGRPGRLYRLAAKSQYIAGVCVNVAECEIFWAGLDGIIERETFIKFPTPATYEELLDEIVSRFQEAEASREGRCHGLGLSLPGLLEDSGLVAFSPNMHILDKRNVGPDLEKRLNVSVVSLHEVHALSLAELMLGEADGLSNFAVVDLTEGLGMGAFLGGRFMQGTSGFAGELGHITVVPDGRPCGCGNRGCLETVATDRALQRALSEKRNRELSMDEVLALVQSGEAKAEFNQFIGYLGIAVAAVINLFNPQAVILYGRIFECREIVIPALEREIATRALQPAAEDCRLIVAHADKASGTLGALLDSMFSRVGPVLA